MEKDVFTITFICKLSMVKRGIHGCQMVKRWTVVTLFCVNLAKLKPFLRMTFTVPLATTEIRVRLGRWKRSNSQFCMLKVGMGLGMLQLMCAVTDLLVYPIGVGSNSRAYTSNQSCSLRSCESQARSCTPSQRR